MPKQVRGTAVPPRNTLEPALTKKKECPSQQMDKYSAKQGPQQMFLRTYLYWAENWVLGVPERPQGNSVLKPCYQIPEVGTDMIFVTISILLLAGAVIP